MMKTSMQFLNLAKLCNNMLLSILFCIVSIENLKRMHIYFILPLHSKSSWHITDPQRFLEPISCVNLAKWSCHCVRVASVSVYESACTLARAAVTLSCTRVRAPCGNGSYPLHADLYFRPSGIGLHQPQHSHVRLSNIRGLMRFSKVNIKHSLQHIAIHCCMHFSNANAIYF